MFIFDVTLNICININNLRHAHGAIFRHVKPKINICLNHSFYKMVSPLDSMNKINTSNKDRKKVLVY